MRAANWASDKGATVAHLSPSALYLLSATGVPEDFVIDILRRAEAGEYVAPSVMREELKAFRLNSPQQRCGTRISSQPASRGDWKWEAVATESEARGAVAELVAILVQGLSAADFARVRDIVTSDTVLSDPQLAQKLERAFGRATQDCLAPV
jgi:hypothetical protein